MRLRFWKKQEDSKFVQRSEREVRLAGLFDDDAEYGGLIGQSVMEVVRLLSSQGHSGYSIQVVMGVTQALVDGQALMPLTSDPDDWMKVTDGLFSEDDPPVWQNRRQSSAFSNDGGKTWTLVDDETKTVYSDTSMLRSFDA